MGPFGCTEISVSDYQSPLRNVPVGRRSHLHLGGSLKLCESFVIYNACHMYKDSSSSLHFSEPFSLGASVLNKETSDYFEISHAFLAVFVMD
jgi:hypothetical protein